MSVNIKENGQLVKTAGLNIQTVIIDNLTTQDSTKALSAKQGYVLNQNKVDKVTGKGLSTNDYTNEDKAKLAGISEGAEPNVQSDWKQSDSSSDDFIKNKPTSDIKTSDDGQFTTVTGGLMQKCLIDLEPIQDLHGYSKPWTGGSGKNKLPIRSASSVTLYGVTFTFNADGTVKVNGTATDNVKINIINGSDSLGKITLAPNTYTYSISDSAKGVTIGFMDTDKRVFILDGQTAISKTYTVSEAVETIPVLAVSSGVTVNNVIFYPMLEIGSSKTTFEPYSNICPISGHTQVQIGNVGKNILDYTYPTTTSNGITCTNNGDGTYTLNGTASAHAIFLLKDKASLNAIYEPHKSSGMKLLGCPSGGGTTTYRLEFWRNNGGLSDVGSGVTIPSNALASSTDWNLAIIVMSGQTVNNLVFKPMLTKDLSATYADFEPYNGYTTTINLGGTYYGGKLDAVSGDGSTDEVLIDLGDLTWNGKDSSDRFYAEINDIKSNATGDYTTGLIMCSAMGIDASVITSSSSASDFTIAKFTDSGLKRIYVKCSSISSASDFKTAVTGTKLLYQKATPTTIQLDPQTLETLVGQNDVFAPLTGQTVEEVEFREVMAFEDVEAYTDTKADISAIAPVENGTTASQAYAIGEHFYRNRKFCTAITSISQGATFTLNTNYIEGDVANAFINKNNDWIVADEGTFTTSTSEDVFVENDANIGHFEDAFEVRIITDLSGMYTKALNVARTIRGISYDISFPPWNRVTNVEYKVLIRKFIGSSNSSIFYSAPIR